MSLDIVDLRSFYATPLGAVARNLVLRVIRSRWESLKGEIVMGLGYATPYLGPYRVEALRAVAFMPAAQGVVNWPSSGLSSSSLVTVEQLPLRDGAIDRAIVAHALEMARDPEALLAELWRCLAPGGRIMLVVPNRSGVWARVDHTPFGHGQPYSRSQLATLMRKALLTPTAWDEALYVPPLKLRPLLAAARTLDRTCRALGLPFAGVHVIEATKQLYRPVPVRRAAKVPLLIPEPAMAPTTG